MSLSYGHLCHDQLELILLKVPAAFKYGKVVWVFAGYSKDMEKLFEHNAGLPSRFPVRFRFPDYKDNELLEIFQQLLANDPNQAHLSSSILILHGGFLVNENTMFIT